MRNNMLTSRLPKLTAVIEAPEGRFVKEMDLRLEDYAISYVTSIVLHQRARLVTWTIHDESGRERTARRASGQPVRGRQLQRRHSASNQRRRVHAVTRVWFTSDTHFNHQAIIDYCGRPFRTPDGHLDVQKMNEALVANWNATVGPNDTVYHLGDFAFGPTPLAARWAARLNGHKVLVKGNHDRLTVTAYRSMGFERIEKRWKLGRIYLIHWPPPDFAAPFGCEVVLCGHVQ
jgi:calcineurin-like phosphoesterase family protein